MNLYMEISMWQNKATFLNTWICVIFVIDNCHFLFIKFNFTLKEMWFITTSIWIFSNFHTLRRIKHKNFIELICLGFKGGTTKVESNLVQWEVVYKFCRLSIFSHPPIALEIMNPNPNYSDTYYLCTYIYRYICIDIFLLGEKHFTYVIKHECYCQVLGFA
jgi:hypothetical protein